MKKTIGFFGGSFDPIHFGHISLALQLLEIHGLDEVVFCPAFCSPFKTVAPPVASPQHRLEMVRFAIQEIPQFQISTLEIDRGGPSYTIDTLRALMQQEKGTLRLLLSEEAAAELDLWKDAGELVRLAPPLVGARSDGTFKAGVTPTRVMDISSTEIRSRLKKKLYCGHLVPAKTLHYIQAHHLYG